MKKMTRNSSTSMNEMRLISTSPRRIRFSFIAPSPEGLTLGIGMTEALVKLMTRTVNDLYYGLNYTASRSLFQVI